MNGRGSSLVQELALGVAQFAGPTLNVGLTHLTCEPATPDRPIRMLGGHAEF